MEKVLLKIESGYETKEVELGEELSIGRSDQADLMLDDPGLSRVNTTFFRDGEEVLIVDEGSTNGTSVNGSRITGPAIVLFDGDEITLGSETRIEVVFGESASSDDLGEKAAESVRESRPKQTATVQNYKPSEQTSDELLHVADSPIILWVAAGSFFLILLFAGIGVFIAYQYETGSLGGGTPVASNSKPIPLRVIDPLGRQKQEKLDELVQYWEVQEREITAEELQQVNVGSKTQDNNNEAEYFNVSVDYWKSQRAKAFQKRKGPTGIWPRGLKVPPILRGDGVVKQKAKLREMQQAGYQIPMDFADLVKKRNEKLLVEMPMATEYWVLEVGGSSTQGQFTSFNFKDHIKSPVAPMNSTDYQSIAQLAQNFSGQRYDMNNGAHRRQMKIRLLRMFNPRAKLALEELAKHYHAKYNRPLRVTSLSRSMEYQISLNKTNANSFKVRGPGSLPPHTSGCAFDLGRKHMEAEEQNYVMAKLEEMEKRGTLDALIEGNVNACFHVFVYEDGVPPKGY